MNPLRRRLTSTLTSDSAFSVHMTASVLIFSPFHAEYRKAFSASSAGRSSWLKWLSEFPQENSAFSIFWLHAVIVSSTAIKCCIFMVIQFRTKIIKNPAYKKPGSLDMLSLLEICKVLLHVGSWRNQDFLEFLLTSTCRDWVSADDIFLKTFEGIDTATDCSLAEYLCSLLE